ncbi:MAG TPA: hypothetical protein VFT98_11525 [Myxococcota bacterium]|nr:hypothetical protein [Myxococcota bacterium]
MPSASPRAAWLVALALSAACANEASRERIALDPSGPKLLVKPFGDLVEQWVDAPGALYVKRPRPDLSAFRGVRFERPGLFYDRRVTPPLVQDHSMLTRALDGAVREAMAAAVPLPESREGGAGVLRVSTEVSNIEFDRARATNSRVTSIIQPGAAATFIIELADDATGTPLVRIAARRAMPGGIYTGPWAPDIDRAIQLFRSFGQDVRLSLVHVVRPVVAPD